MLTSMLTFRLSAYLYEATNNQTYLEAASLSQKFIQAHLTDASTSCIKDLIFLNDCSYPNNFIVTYNTGLYLEGITVLGHTINDTNLIHVYVNLSVPALYLHGCLVVCT